MYSAQRDFFLGGNDCRCGFCDDDFWCFLRPNPVTCWQNSSSAVLDLSNLHNLSVFGPLEQPGLVSQQTLWYSTRKAWFRFRFNREKTPMIVLHGVTIPPIPLLSGKDSSGWTFRWLSQGTLGSQRFLPSYLRHPLVHFSEKCWHFMKRVGCPQREVCPERWSPCITQFRTLAHTGSQRNWKKWSSQLKDTVR